MKHDDFLIHLYTFSTLSEATQKIYMEWISKCCHYHHIAHLLDLTTQDFDAFRLWLLQDKYYSLASDTIVYSALKHTHTVLLPLVDSESSKQYTYYFRKAPRQPCRLPEYVSCDEIQSFFQALPQTVAGNIIRGIYATSKTFEELSKGWKVSKQYAQSVCAKTARKVGIRHGFGLTGVRAASIVHRIQQRENDLELVQIREDSGLSEAQFYRYMKAAEATTIR